MWQQAEHSGQWPFGIRAEWMFETPRGKGASPGAAPGGIPDAPSIEHSSAPTRVLVVDDERLIADTLTRILNLSGFVASALYSGDAAVEAVPTFCPDIVLTDVRMPGRNGIETGILIREQCPHTRIVLFSGQAGIGDLMDEARQSGHGFELWPKPIHPRELVRRLREL